MTLIAIWWAAGTTEQKSSHQRINNTAINGPDPAYLVDETQLDEAVSCPVLMPGARETVLLVSGTGVTWVDRRISSKGVATN